MTTVSRFSRQNDTSLRALDVCLYVNRVLVVVLVLESEALYSFVHTFIYSFIQYSPSTNEAWVWCGSSLLVLYFVRGIFFFFRFFRLNKKRVFELWFKSVHWFREGEECQVERWILFEVMAFCVSVVWRKTADCHVVGRMVREVVMAASFSLQDGNLIHINLLDIKF